MKHIKLIAKPDGGDRMLVRIIEQTNVHKEFGCAYEDRTYEDQFRASNLVRLMSDLGRPEAFREGEYYYVYLKGDNDSEHNFELSIPFERWPEVVVAVNEYNEYFKD